MTLWYNQPKRKIEQQKIEFRGWLPYDVKWLGKGKSAKEGTTVRAFECFKYRINNWTRVLSQEGSICMIILIHHAWTNPQEDEG